MQEMVQYYNVLEVEPWATPDEVKLAYRDMVNVWHPDRFSNNQRLRERAEEKLKIINNAYDKLKDYKPSETDILNFKKKHDVDDTVNKTDQTSSIREESNKYWFSNIFKYILLAIGVISWIGVFCRNHKFGLLIGIIVLGVYLIKLIANKKNSVENNPFSNIEDSILAKRFILEIFVIMANCDGSIQDEEISIIDDVIKKYWPNESHDVILKEAITNISNCDDVAGRFEQNTICLSKLLNKKEKLEVLVLAEMLIKADDKVTNDERVAYAAFKKLLKPSGIGASIFNIFSDKCPMCNSTRIEFKSAEETDRWRGTKTVHERLASGKYKTRTVQTTYIQVRRTYECDECCHVWATESQQER